MNEAYTVIGQIINTHGIRGVVKVYPYTDDLNRFSKLERIFVGEHKDILTVNDVFIRKNFVYLSFEGFDSINDVLPLKTSYIYIPDSERIPLEEDQFYIADIIGIEVYDESGQGLGTVEELLQGPANDVFVIRDGEKTWMLPGVKDFVLSVEPENHRMIVRPIEGMRE